MKHWISVILMLGFLFATIMASSRSARADDMTQPNISQDQDSSIQDLKNKVEEQQQIIQDLMKRIEAIEKSQQAAPAAKGGGEPITLGKPGFHMKVYGFVKADTVSESRRTLTSGLFPFAVLSPADKANQIQQSGTLAMTAYSTRIGASLDAPMLGAWKPTGVIETDFIGKTAKDAEANNSRRAALLRMRRAFMKFADGDWSLLFGQEWEPMAFPLPSLSTPHNPYWNMGNVGDRRPEILIAHQPKTGYQFEGAIGLPGAVNNLDLTGDTFRDAENSGRPLYEVRLGYAWPSRVSGKSYEFHVFGAQEWFKVTDCAAAVSAANCTTGHTLSNTVTQRDFQGKIMGADFTAPLNDWFLFKTKLWTGSGLSDFRGGISQFVNTNTGVEIASRGGWAQMGWRVKPWYWIYTGYAIDNPLYGDLSPGTGGISRASNSVYTLTQLFDVGGGLHAGVDYWYMTTKYVGNPTGITNLVNLTVYQEF